MKIQIELSTKSAIGHFVRASQKRKKGKFIGKDNDDLKHTDQGGLAMGQYPSLNHLEGGKRKWYMLCWKAAKAFQVGM